MFTGFPAIVAVSQNITVATPSTAYFSQSSSNVVQIISSTSVLSSTQVLSSTIQSSVVSSSLTSSSSAVSSDSEKKPEVAMIDAPPIIEVKPISSTSKVMTDLVKPVVNEIPKSESKPVDKAEIKQEIKTESKVASVAQETKIISSIIEIKPVNISSSSISSSSVFFKMNLTYSEKIKARCEEVGCNSTQLIRVMMCESTGRQSAYNAAGPYIGLFQFLPSTFNAYARKIGLPNADVNNGDDQITVATWMFAQGMSSQWGCK